MKKFFTRIGRGLTIFKNILVYSLLLLIIVEVVALVVLSRPSLPEQGILVLELKGSLVEQTVRPGTEAIPFAIPNPNQTQLRDLIKVIRAAEKDPRVLALRLKLDHMRGGSSAKLQDIRLAIESFKRSGKPVLAAQYNYSQSQYYLAASADEVWLHSLGAIDLHGISMYPNYFRDALDKLLVKVHVFKAGKYKSAVEPFIRNSMSEAARESNSVWMDVLWTITKQDIATMRDISPQRIQLLLDQPVRFLQAHQGNMPALLKQEKLIDFIGDPREADDKLAVQLGFADRNDVEEINFKAYLYSLNDSPEKSSNHIAIVTASGTILSGHQPSGTAGGDTLAELLDEAANDEETKAVVLRVDSPGGSAQASEVIRAAVARVQASGKPVVVSMGSLAASGGYWISANADEIWAQPSTLTGSIGVFGIIPNLSKSLNKIGIHSDGLGTSNSAEGVRLSRPLSKDMQRVVQMGVEHIYRQFVTIVAQGREMTVEQADAIAQGRVWSGLDAERIGLVDHLGNIDDSIKAAARLAKIENDYQSYDLVPPKAWSAMMAERLFGESKLLFRLFSINGLPSWLPSSVIQPLIQQFSNLNLLLQEPTHVYALSDLQDQSE